MNLGELKDRLQRDKRLSLTVKVIAKSSRNEVAALLEDGTLKLKITAAPEKGKANAGIRSLLAREFQVRPKNFAIVRGELSTTKHIVLSLD